MVDEIRRLINLYRRDPAALIMAAWAFAAYVAYFWSTSARDYAMDLRGHFIYIKFVSEYLALPAPQEGWQFYHPPLYYLITGLLHKLLVALDVARPIESLRLFSLACYAVWLHYGYLSLRLAVPRGRAFYAAFSLLLFWPIGIVIATRIDGYVLVNALLAPAFYYLLRWQRRRREEDLVIAIALTALAVLTRSSALIMAGVIAVVVGRELWHKRAVLRRPALLAALAVVLAAGFNTARVSADSEDGNVLVANFRHIDPRMIIENTPAHLLGFDFGAYFEPPFYNVRRDETGRQYYAVALLKTSLYGEFNWDYVALAKTLNALLLALIAFTLAGLTAQRPRAWFPLLALPGAMVAGSLYARLQYPAGSTQDFRYIFPVLIPLVILYANACRAFVKRGQQELALVGVGTAWAFAALSALFIMLNVAN